MTLQNPPVVKQQMLIRRPVAEVFEAFINPAITTKFWFTKSTGRLEAGRTVRWEWEMYGVSADVRVMSVEPQRRILIEWNHPPLPVEWHFSPLSGDTTLVTISSWGFPGTGDEMVGQALDSMGGFSFVLAAAKALLEHDVILKLVADHNPEAQQGQTG